MCKLPQQQRHAVVLLHKTVFLDISSKLKNSNFHFGFAFFPRDSVPIISCLTDFQISASTLTERPLVNDIFHQTVRSCYKHLFDIYTMRNHPWGNICVVVRGTVSLKQLNESILPTQHCAFHSDFQHYL